MNVEVLLAGSKLPRSHFFCPIEIIYSEIENPGGFEFLTSDLKEEILELLSSSELISARKISSNQTIKPTGFYGLIILAST